MKLFFLMAFSYTLIAYNMRVLAQGKYIATIISDGIIAIVGFTLLKSVQGAETWADLFFYSTGGMVGGASGIWLSKIDFKKEGWWGLWRDSSSCSSPE
jgi:hypothetical protein